MKVFILLDDRNIVRCAASEEENLHPDKLHMKKLYVDCGGTVGDEYNLETGTWIPHPENYPQPSPEEVREQKIQDEMQVILRKQAVRRLRGRGEL